MSDMSLDTRVMSFDRVFSLLRSLVSRYSSQASTKVCLKDGRTQRAYGAMLMGIKKVGKNWHVTDIACFPTVCFEHPATYSMMFNDAKHNTIIMSQVCKGVCMRCWSASTGPRMHRIQSFVLYSIPTWNDCVEKSGHICVHGQYNFTMIQNQLRHVFYADRHITNVKTVSISHANCTSPFWTLAI